MVVPVGWTDATIELPDPGMSVGAVYVQSGNPFSTYAFHAPTGAISASQDDTGHHQYLPSGTFFLEGWYTTDPLHQRIENVTAWKILDV